MGWKSINNGEVEAGWKDEEETGLRQGGKMKLTVRIEAGWKDEEQTGLRQGGKMTDRI